MNFEAIKTVEFRAPIFTNFLRLNFDRSSLALKFEPYDDLVVVCAQKISRNYENIYSRFREYVLRLGFEVFNLH